MQGEGRQEMRGHCELLLTDTPGSEIDFAATSAHVLMTEAEMNHLDTGMLETGSIQQTLDEVTMRYREGKLKGEHEHRSDNSTHAWLSHPPTQSSQFHE